ncbi:MAG: hypothetical protein ACK5H4_06440 [Lacrimispora sphenoides]|jgi:hypothetical protein
MENMRQRDYIGYEYKEVVVESGQISQYLDGYENFGWLPIENHQIKEKGNTILRLKRDRKIINKAELTRLQQNFEDCMKQIDGMEKSKHQTAVMAALTIGLIGTAFMAGATFAAVNQPPIVWLCILLAIPGFMGWITSYFVYNFMLKKRNEMVAPLIEAKYEEIHTVCEKGNHLLGNG